MVLAASTVIIFSIESAFVRWIFELETQFLVKDWNFTENVIKITIFYLQPKIIEIS